MTYSIGSGMALAPLLPHGGERPAVMPPPGSGCDQRRGLFDRRTHLRVRGASQRSVADRLVRGPDLDTGAQAFLGQLLQGRFRGPRSMPHPATVRRSRSSDTGCCSHVSTPMVLSGRWHSGLRQATMDRADSGIVNEHFAANRGAGASLVLGEVQRMPDCRRCCGRRVSAPHLPVWPVGFRQDLHPGSGARAAAARDRYPDRCDRPPFPTMSNLAPLVPRAIPDSTTTGTGPWPSDTLWSQGVSTCSVGGLGEAARRSLRQVVARAADDGAGNRPGARSRGVQRLPPHRSHDPRIRLRPRGSDRSRAGLLRRRRAPTRPSHRQPRHRRPVDLGRIQSAGPCSSFPTTGA